MKITPTLEYYNRIMSASDEDDIVELNMEIQTAVLTEILTDDRDIMMLNMALQIKSNYFLMKDMLLGGNTTIIVTGGEDFDPEELQLEEFKDQELEDFKDGNVVSLKDFAKKKK